MNLKSLVGKLNFIAVLMLAFIAGNVSKGLAQNAVISLNRVDVYALPMEDKNPVTVLTKGDTVRIIGQRGVWVKIEYAENRKGWMKLQVKRNSGSNGKATNGHVKNASKFSKDNKVGNGSSKPDIIKKRPPDKPAFKEEYGKFGYEFGMGLLESDFSYSWQFIFHTSPRLALEGSFKHVLGDAADSYFLTANWSYILKEDSKFLPYITGGMGVINTMPERSIGSDGVSNMAINVGIGARKHFRNSTSFTFGIKQYTIFIGNGMSHFREFRVGFLVGKFWN